MVIITKHGEKRIRERSGINKKAVERIVQKAYDVGFTREDTTGQLKKWIDRIYEKNLPANRVRIYGDNMYLFANEYLITMIQIPNELRKNIKNGQKRICDKYEIEDEV